MTHSAMLVRWLSSGAFLLLTSVCMLRVAHGGSPDEQQHSLGLATAEGVVEALAKKHKAVKLDDANYSGWRGGRDCGPLALYGLLAIEGCPHSLAKVRECLPVSEKGSSLQDLQNAGQQLGLNLRIRQYRSSDLRSLQPPVIFHLSGVELGHYVIFMGLDPDDSHPIIADFSNCSIDPVATGELLRSWSLYGAEPVRAIDRVRDLALYAGLASAAVCVVLLLRQSRQRSVAKP